MLRVAVCGAGEIATKKHLPSWKRAANCQLVALCDINRATAEPIASKFRVPNVFVDIGEMLTKEKPDIVDICTPPKTHLDVACQAIQGGAHVMIEKPMAMTVAECDQIIEASKKQNKKICVGHSDLFYDAFMKARNAVGQGEIGDFCGMRIFLCTHRDYITSNSDHWCHRLPGGVIGETGPHIIYMSMAFINNINHVEVTPHKIIDEYTWSPFEDYRVILSNGKLASSVVLTYTSNQWGARIDLFGSTGLLSVDLQTQTVVKYRRPTLTAIDAGRSVMSEAWQLARGGVAVGIRKVLGRIPSTHDILVREFTSSILNDTPSPVSGEEGKEVVHLLKEIADQVEKQYTPR